MLPRAHRVTSKEQFRSAVRIGRRAGSRTLVVHVLGGDLSGEETLGTPAKPLSAPPTVGFVVSRTVGNAVVRNRVKRRLRHLAAQRLDRLGAGTTLIIRAHAASARATTAELAADLDRALTKAMTT